ncbi:glycosyltransferase family 2 protein [Cryobacterium sp. TMT2-14]|uniref:glycosyltransferase family 2 protein n=2 Tax=unclassified Cryobacterium TaxID=2649013 RepID=UPI00106C133D|nr:glycosyltransferase family 2 protein [Cryobacterium sp. TMT2-14]TFC33348.1 glycosyltransferase family 2 protein [Cryobacterium sp. TMT2-42-4]TFC37095.1 glycosyltransferase family 2 protein [Cryobacterium sp. TMT2-14]
MIDVTNNQSRPDEGRDMNDSVVIVTVTHNSSTVLPRFLATVRGATRVLAPIVVVDNASQDVAEAKTVSEAGQARFLGLDSNRGYGDGIAQGIASQEATADFILISNPDVEFAAGSLDILLEAARNNPQAGSLGPRIVDPAGTTYPSARPVPSLSTGIGHALFSRIWPANPWTRSYRPIPVVASHDIVPAGWLSGACLLVRRSAYDSVGGFDTSYFMYFEDVDLGDRLGKHGWTNLYVPEAVVVHTGAHSTSQSRDVMERKHHESAYQFLSRKYSAWYFSPVRAILRLGLHLRGRWHLPGR